MVEVAKDGQREAHTPRDPAAIEPSSAAIEDGAALPGADPLALLVGSPDLDASDLLAMAAEPVLQQRRARGRPAGAGNRKNGDMIGYLAALGHRDPWVTLSLIQSADTGKLAMALRSPAMKNGKQMVSKAGTPLFNTPEPGEVLALQMRAAEALMKYHHSAKPQQLDLPPGDKRPLMVIGDGANVNVLIAGGYASDEFLPPEKPNEINGTAVREGEA